MADRPFIYCFASDLRLDDHAGLAAAASQGIVIPLLVIDPAMAGRLTASPRRGAFFCAAVHALDGELRERGSSLIVRRGPIEKQLLDVALQSDAGGAAWSASYDRAGMQRDGELQSALEERGLGATIVHDRPAIAPEETAAMHTGQGPGYRAFAPYFDAWCALRPASYEQPLLLRFARPGIAAESLPQPREFGAGDSYSRAGSVQARRRFEEFLRERAPVYATQANVPVEDGTSQLSADLSFGTISARAVVRAVCDRLEDPFSISEQRLSLRAYLRALAHRDFFLQLSWFNPQTNDEPLQSKMRDFGFARTHPGLDAWRAGRTGFPLVDAGIRQLHETGWMHPHVRAVAASVLCFDLGVDWRVGRDEWDRWLIEDDSALATGNWQWIAGVGADMAQYPRIYNPERQRRRYDPSGAYVRRWVKELAHVPVEAWYGRTLQSPQLSLELFDHATYPAAVVDHASTARAFLRRYSEFVVRSVD
jgi:deoxyribodipyrimidine photo-lyase